MTEKSRLERELMKLRFKSKRSVIGYFHNPHTMKLSQAKEVIDFGLF